MTASGARPPRRTYREFCRVDGDAVLGKFTVRAHPHPLHHATVIKEGNARVGWSWVVRFPTFGPMAASRVFPDMGQALNFAADAVGRRTGADLMRFDGAQRYAMGQGKCPFRDRGHPRLCEQTAEGHTVWCGDHRGGRARW